MVLGALPPGRLPGPRHRATVPVLPPLPASVSRTATGVYECPGCGDRLAGQRRCDSCNLFARRLDQGGCCLSCGDGITVRELLNIA